MDFRQELDRPAKNVSIGRAMTIPSNPYRLHSKTLQRTSALLAGLALLMACASTKPSIPQDAPKPSHPTPRSRVIALKQWLGHYKLHAHSKGTWTQGDKRVEWMDDLELSGMLRLHMTAEPGLGTGSLMYGFYSLTADARTASGEQILETQQGSCSNSVKPLPTENMSFPTDDTYLFRAVVSQATQLRCEATRTVTGEESQPFSVAAPAFPSLPASLFTFPLPAENGERQLKARLRFITVGDKVVQSLPTTPAWGEKPIAWEIDWDLRPEATDVDFTMGAESQETYDTWLPKGPVIPPSPESGTETQAP